VSGRKRRRAIYQSRRQCEALAAGQEINQNRFEEAIKDASQAVERAPDDARPHRALGAGSPAHGTKRRRAKRIGKSRRGLESKSGSVPALLKAEHIKN
jgi:Flp pilus assembly protein TadD